jgi:release factor glutamine methyltransferase
MGLDLRVTPAVLIPRPETESVVEYALEVIRERSRPRVLDIGTGSGCIAIAIAHFRPDALVEAWDVSPEALRVAEENARRNDVSVRFKELDVLTAAAREACWDLVVSNPPYVPLTECEGMQPDVVGFEPHLAIFAGEDPLRFYRAIASLAGRMLSPGGHVVLETHAEYGRDVGRSLTEAGLKNVTIQADLSGRDRIAAATRPR